MGEFGAIETEEQGDVTVVSLVGEHDLLTGDVVRKQLGISATSGRGLVVSLMKTTFFDSQIVHALFDAHHQLGERNRKLVLHVATASIVRRVLDVSSLSDTVSCTGSIEEAIALAGKTHQEDNG